MTVVAAITSSTDRQKVGCGGRGPLVHGRDLFPNRVILIVCAAYMPNGWTRLSGGTSCPDNPDNATGSSADCATDKIDERPCEDPLARILKHVGAGLHSHVFIGYLQAVRPTGHAV